MTGESEHVNPVAEVAEVVIDAWARGVAVGREGAARDIGELWDPTMPAACKILLERAMHVIRHGPEPGGHPDDYEALKRRLETEIAKGPPVAQPTRLLDEGIIDVCDDPATEDVFDG